MWQISHMSANDNQWPPPADPAACRHPDFAACQVAPVGISNLQFCRTREPAGCPYTVAYADKAYCFYPDPSKFGNPTA